jgi:hypothetical protein
MGDYQYYAQKLGEMLMLAATSTNPRAKQEFERLAEEYKTLAKSCRDAPGAKVVNG